MNYDDVTFRSHDRRCGIARQGRHLAPSRSVSNIAAQLQGNRMRAAAKRAGTTKAPNFATDRTALLLISRVLTFYADRAMQKKRADWQLRPPQTPEPRTGQ